MSLAVDKDTTLGISAGPRFKKADEFRRIFATLPNVLIQDPARGCAYYIPAKELGAFEATPETWGRIDDSTVTFVIPNGGLVDEVPPYLRNPELHPSVLIRFGQYEGSYFLSFDELQRFRTAQPRESLDDNQISFIVPAGTELIEELPALRRAMLQSNTQ